MDQNAAPIIDALREFDQKKIISYDVPGHKRRIHEDDFQKLVGKEVYLMDVNAPVGLDTLADPKGVIKESLELAAEAYKADNAFYLVNGSSSGVQIMIMTVCYDGEKILIPRNSHKSVTNALILSGAVPVFMEPEINQKFGIAGGMTLQTIQKYVLANPDAKALFLVYPTYYGACFDLKQIIEYAHSKDIVVMVDQAHGAHFSFSSALPKSAAELGADLVVASTHKTGGSLTQSAMLLHSGNLVKYHSVKKRVLMLHTTSPSYLLMASLESARKLMATKGEEIFSELVHECRKVKKEISKIPGLSVLDETDTDSMTYDPTKIVVNVTKLGLDGFDVYDIMFEKYGIQLELAEPAIVLAVIGIGDTKETVGKLADAFKDLSASYYGKYEMLDIPEDIVYVPPQIMSPRQAFYADKISVGINEAVGRVAAEAVMIYPPGIPICIPGELITADMADEILYCQKNSNCVQKDSKETGQILVVDGPIEIKR